MPDYKSMYFSLFNKVADAITLLQQAQINGENTFISTGDMPSIEFLDLQKCDEQEP